MLLMLFAGNLNSIYEWSVRRVGMRFKSERFCIWSARSEKRALRYSNGSHVKSERFDSRSARVFGKKALSIHSLPLKFVPTKFLLASKTPSYILLGLGRCSCYLLEHSFSCKLYLSRHCLELTPTTHSIQHTVHNKLIVFLLYFRNHLPLHLLFSFYTAFQLSKSLSTPTNNLCINRTPFRRKSCRHRM